EASVTPKPAPPYFSGIITPNNPACEHVSQNSCGNRCSTSALCQYLSLNCLLISRAVLFNINCSCFNLYFIFYSSFFFYCTSLFFYYLFLICLLISLSFLFNINCS